jgi:inner membrane protein YidH
LTRVDQTQDAIERTDLANERTQLAWWRTGLTSLAVALAVGRVLPDLSATAHAWAYTVVGVGFAVYSMLLIGYGTARASSVRASLSHGGRVPNRDRVLLGLTAIGVVLAAATTLLIVLD